MNAVANSAATLAKLPAGRHNAQLTNDIPSRGVAGSASLPPGATEVEFTLTPTPAGTRLRLVHRGLAPGQEEIHATGWQHFLARLTRAAAGKDPGADPWYQDHATRA